MRTRFLGRFVVPPGGGGAFKACVMGYLRSPADADTKRPPAPPRFSKYSGIQEWNNAVALFVNVGGGTGYANVWSDGCRKMAWFAQPGQSPETRVIKRMLEHHHQTSGAEGGQAEDSKPTPILLFIRNVGEAYVFCGNVTVVPGELSLSSRPMRFTWQLSDYDTLMRSNDWQTLVDFKSK